MPKSKRDKKITLSKTSKKGLVLKQKIVDDVRQCAQKYKSVYVFTYKDLRNQKIKDIRTEWKGSRFIFGKTRMLRMGLGRTPEDEADDGLHLLSQKVNGYAALLFTDCTKEEVVDWFNNFSYIDYARAGFKVKHKIELKPGPLTQFPHSMEPYLRQLGLPTELKVGIVHLREDFVVCDEDSVLTPERAKMLELLDYRLVEFRLNLKACWIKGQGFEEFDDADDSENDATVEDE